MALIIILTSTPLTITAWSLTKAKIITSSKDTANRMESGLPDMDRIEDAFRLARHECEKQGITIWNATRGGAEKFLIELTLTMFVKE